MKIRLRNIIPDDERATAQLNPGEVVMHEVALDVDGQSRTFTVYLKSNVLPDLDASLVYGDELLEELFRFEPAGLSRLCKAVAKRRRGERLPLPIVLVEAEVDEAQPRLEQLAIRHQTL